MVAAARNSVGRCGPARRAAARVVFLFAALLLPQGTVALSQEVRPDRGLFITVQNPITSEVVKGIVAKSNGAVTNGKVTKLIFDFNHTRPVGEGPLAPR